MDFKTELAQFTAAEIIDILECPRATAQQWVNGIRQPPKWQQRHWLDILQRGKRKPARRSTTENPPGSVPGLVQPVRQRRKSLEP